MSQLFAQLLNARARERKIYSIIWTSYACPTVHIHLNVHDKMGKTNNGSVTVLRWPTTVTAKYNSSRQNKIRHGKIQFETTNSNYSRQTTNTHGKNKNNYCNSKFITARAKHSRQKQNTHGKSKTLTPKSRMAVSGCPSTWCTGKSTSC